MRNKSTPNTKLYYLLFFFSIQTLEKEKKVKKKKKNFLLKQINYKVKFISASLSKKIKIKCRIKEKGGERKRANNGYILVSLLSSQWALYLMM